jgi:hypothetical protein
VGAAHQLLRAPLAVQLRHEQRRDEHDAERRDHDPGDLAEQRTVVLERLAETGGRHPERDEHDREGEAEQERRREHLRAALPLLDVGERHARDRGQVAGHEREHARRHERDEADGECGEDRGVDTLVGDHRS